MVNTTTESTLTSTILVSGQAPTTCDEALTKPCLLLLSGYFGKVGMRHYHLTRNAYHCPVVNLDKLWTMVPAEQRKGLSASSTEVPVIDTLAAGYSKVLGKGRLPQLPCIVKARWVSELAEKKIKEAGGVVQVRRRCSLPSLA